MSLRSRTFFIVGITAIVLLLLITVSSRVLIVDSYARLEEKLMAERVASVRYSLETEEADLDRNVSDWGPWDDTYLFVQGKNFAYPDLNLQPETFENLRLNLFIVLDEQGKIYFGEEYDLQSGEFLPLSENAAQIIKQYPCITETRDEPNCVGLIRYKDQVLLIASHPLLTSKHEGPIKGMLIMARYLNSDLVGQISSAARQNFELHLVDEVGLQADEQAALTELDQPEEVLFKAHNMKESSGYTLLRDLHGEPLALLAVHSDRDVYNQGVRSESYFHIVILILCIFFIFAVVNGLESMVLRPLRTIIDRIIFIRETNDLSLRVETSKRDELGMLAREINSTLSSLEISRHALLENEKRLKYSALHDSLTNLHNREYLNARMERAVEIANENNGATSALLFIDLDRFKLINDSFDHLHGDQLLIAISRRLEETVRGDDVIARLGGDEFVILLEGIDSEERTEEIARRVLKAISQPVEVEGNRLIVSGSIGIAMTCPGERAEDLLRNADIAMYRAKSRGRNRIEFFSGDPHNSNKAALTLDYELRTALEREEMVVYYQPIYSTQQEKIVAVEALLRWKTQNRGLLMPNAFIPLAEEAGLMTSINEWVLARAMQQLAKWRNEGLSDLSMSVNLTSHQLQDVSLPDQVGRVLRENGLPGSALRLEVSESAAMVDFDQALQIMNELRHIGVQISIDDFGTGYSSLSYLRQIPAAHIKVDKSFMPNLGREPRISAIVDTIITMAHNLELQVVAEGVETQGQVDYLRSHGVEELQGYFFSQALPPDQVVQLLKTEQMFVDRAAD